MLAHIENNSMESFVANPLPRELMGRFRVLKSLGRGGLSSVYLVEDQQNGGIPLALKLLHPNKIDAVNLKRFKKEFEVLKEIQHPNLIEAYELIEVEGSIGYLMEAIEGSNLLELLRLRKPEHQEIDLIFSQVLSALYELHQNQLIHRDIKLENVLIREDGLVKLSDLGLMRKLDGAEDPDAGVLLGTTQYLPPEYVKHSVYNFRSDIYATGLMLFECLTCKRWLEGKHGKKAIDYLCDKNFDFPKLALAGLPYKYQGILETALAVQPWKRFTSAEAMRQAILSETGNIDSVKTVQVAENICIRAAQERRKTAEFLSLQARHDKMILRMAGFLGATALIAMVGIATLRTQTVNEPLQSPGILAPSASQHFSVIEKQEKVESQIKDKTAKDLLLKNKKSLVAQAKK